MSSHATLFRTALLVLLTCCLLPVLRAQTQEPRDTVSAENATRARYAKDLDELERMKEKFRKQQEEKQRRRDGVNRIGADWDAAPAPEPLVISDRDTTVLRSTVRSGLYSDQRPAAYERREWENSVQDDLPQQQVEAQYSQPMREVQGEPAGLTPKAPEPIPGASPLGVTFIPNTAYPNSGGYSALEALAATVRNAQKLVEIRVHTSRKLNPRAAQLLSEERATTIRKYLVEAGISNENFRVIGYGNHESAAGERVEVIQ
ncbi:outer membrane protein OmpA-like peptidoglycan-associated protein [Lewinella aquimaris]|uniref:Outer membrane protein OmpA-like peptidoglycan-associated protein n=1 Tax=Neolewinella aquimaris TaxID=1835722 RepID=A0A840E5G3_9BACT|nr:OmpA family protein [Neolewinella aquimaris]MBB4078962.1 outer membrane protein OmpA-like peptidoglycan-associated protein [Neolewinella aquimaris]